MGISVYSTLVLSVAIQAIVAIIDITVALLKVPSEIFLLKQLLIMEVIVQIVEGMFYSYWLYNFKAIANVTPNRYADWSITTPTMLITLIFYLIFLQYRELGRTDELEFFDLFQKNLGPLTNILSLNWAMLFFGYLHLLTFQTPIICKPVVNNHLYNLFIFRVLFFGTYFSGLS